MLISIQYLRGLAALAVVASHTSHTAVVGQVGVDIFFVISGFITWTITSKASRPAAFLWRRFVRIAPLYWIATAIMAVHQDAPLEAAAKSALFIPYYGEGGNIWPVLVQGWTLNYEMYFYALIAAAMLFPRRVGLCLLAGVMATVSLAHVFVAAEDPLLMTYTNPLVLEFLAGIGLAELWRRSWLPGPRPGLALIIAGLFALGLPAIDDPPGTWRFLLWGLPSLLIVAGALSIEVGGWMARIPSLGLLGDASFSIYLFHPFALRTVMTFLEAHPLEIQALGVMVVSSVIGVLMFRLVERPMTARLRQIAW